MAKAGPHSSGALTGIFILEALSSLPPSANLSKASDRASGRRSPRST